MDAVHLARGVTGRDVILKIEGSYHGHHDAVMVSVYPPLEALGERDDPRSVPYGAGYPQALTELTRAVPFNDADALEGVLAKLEGQVAGLIMEPAMMNINIIPPVEGYLERVRELHRRARRQADLRRGQDRRDDRLRRRDPALRRQPGHGQPGQGDLRRLPRRRDRDDRRARRAGRRPTRSIQFGTFNGNPLVMAAAEATLTQVLTADAYEKLEATNESLQARCDEIIERYGLPCLHRRASGAKGCVIFSAEPLREYRDYLTKVDAEPPDAGLALPHEPRHLHDPGRRGGVDALDRPHRGRSAALRRRADRVRRGRHRLRLNLSRRRLKLRLCNQLLRSGRFGACRHGQSFLAPG